MLGAADRAAPAAQAEIEKVKARREQRAAERAQQEEELSLIARQRAEAEGLEAEAKEEEVRSGCMNPLGVLSLHVPEASVLEQR